MATTKIPPLMLPYLSPSTAREGDLLLLTSVLGSTGNWLILRYLLSHLSQPPSPSLADVQQPATGNTVILVSFLRDIRFWADAAKRLGLDLEALGRKGRFVLVDGLGELYLPQHSMGQSALQKQRKDEASSWVRKLRLGNGETGVRGVGKVGEEVKAVLEEVASKGDARDDGQGRKTGGENRTVLLVDGLDFVLMSAAGDENGQAEAMLDVVFAWRELVHKTFFALAADDPFLHPTSASQPTPLEHNHASLLLQFAHQASLILALRPLDTGGASDVSGVLRITKGGGYRDEGREGVEEKELLYHVGTDGGVKVFGRGESRG